MPAGLLSLEENMKGDTSNSKYNTVAVDPDQMNMEASYTFVYKAEFTGSGNFVFHSEGAMIINVVCDSSSAEATFGAYPAGSGLSDP